MIHAATAALSALLFPSFISDASIVFSNSVFSVLLFVAVLLALRSAAKLPKDRRASLYTHALGLLFSVMTAFGYALEHLKTVPYLKPAFAASILVYAHVFAQLLRLMWHFLQSKESCLSASACADEKSGGLSRLSRAVVYMLERPLILSALFLLCWTPCYISTFPGNLIYDASYEYYQLADGFSRSFPLLHSAIVTRLFHASEQLTGSVNAGVAVYVITQMLFMVALFTHIVRRFHSQRLHPLLLGVLAAYYALFPVVHLLVTCTTRDVLFSALLTWLVYLFYCLACDPDRFMASLRHVILLAAVLVLTLLSRNNNSGPLAAVLLLILCAIVGISFGRKHIRNVFIFAASSLVFFLGVNAALVSLCQPLYNSPPSSSMSILAQPIVRAYTLHGAEWTAEERAEFESYFTMETLEYVPQNADPAKGNLQVRYANLRPLLELFIKTGLRHPACYLDAVLANTQQMWFPASVIDGYTVRGMYPGYDKCYFYFGRYIEEIGSRQDLLPAVFAFYEDIGLNLSFEKIPVVSMLFSIGFHVWILLHCIFYAAYRKARPLFWPLLILSVYTLCCAFVPLVLLRYFGALFLAFPMTLVFTLCPFAAQMQRRE